MDFSGVMFIHKAFRRGFALGLGAFSLEVNMNIIRLGGGERIKACVRALDEWCRGRELSHSRLVILPIPTTRDGVTINGDTNTFEDLISLADIRTMIAGYGMPPDVKCRLEELGATVYDAALDEEFLSANAKITAHGALGRMLTEDDRDISELSVGVIGYGRIGSALSELLMFLGARVKIFSGSEEKIIALASLGAEVSTVYDGDFSHLDIIINTAPKRILSDSEEVELLLSGVRIIDLASGKNFSSDEVCVMASIPDKMYPLSSGRLYAKHIMCALTGRVP